MGEIDLRIKTILEGQKELASLAKSFDDAGGRLDALSGTAKKGFSGIQSFALGAAGGIAAAGIGAIVDGLSSSIDLASSKAEAASKAGVIFGSSLDGISRAAESAATTVGMSSGKYLEAAGNLGNLTTNMGLTQPAAAAMSQGMITLAADLASFNNADPSAVLAAMQSGLVGETEPMRQFGVMIDEATVKAKAMALGLYDGKGAMEGSARAQSIYQLMLEQTTAAQGDFARTADGLANQQRIGAAKQEEAWTRLGAAILPLANIVMPLLADAVSAIAGVISTVIAAVQSWAANNRPLLDTISRIAALVMGALKTAFDTIWAVIGRVIAIFSSLVEGYLVFYRAVLDTGSKVFDGLVGAIKAVVGWFGSLWSTISDIGGRIMAFLGGLFRPLGDGINAAIDVVRRAWDAFAGFWNGIGISIPEIRIPNPLGGDFVVGGGRLDLPHLPTLDRGGIVSSPTLALLAANSRPEAIVPLDALGGGITINVYAGVGDPVAIGREVVAAVRAFERSNGPAWAAA
jgi:phage-related protein